MAQLVYNDGWVRGSFDLMGWVHVSQKFDLCKLTLAIAESLTRKQCGCNELSAVHRVLKKKVHEKSVFLVLDDLWNEQQNFWQDLICPLKFAKTLTVLVTTRSKEVARLVQTVHPFVLGSLPDDYSWLLFQHYAFGDRSIDEESSLVQVGKKIMQKCGGLPLAVKSVGCLLHCKMDMDTWMEISESEFWENSDDNEEIFSALRLSFYRLPARLKPCFLLCALYPKGQQFIKDEMIHFWIAHGCIQPTRCNTPEKVAGEFFDELIERSLIETALELCEDRQFLGKPLARLSLEISSDHLFKDQNLDESNIRSLVENFREIKPKASDQSHSPSQRFRLHDMVWDLAKSLASHVLSETADDEGNVVVSDKVEHLFLWGRPKSFPRINPMGPSGQSGQSQECCISEDCSCFLTVQNQVSHMQKLNYLRTFVLKYWNCDFHIDIHRFVYLRAPVLHSIKDTGCISAIRYLKHLRYLQVTNCDPMICENLKHLIESVCHLYSLEKLIVSTCCQEFSMQACKLFNLRYLHLSVQSLHPLSNLRNLDTLFLQNCSQIREIPSFIGNLMNLRRFQLAQMSKIEEFNHDAFRYQTNNCKLQLAPVIFPSLEELEFDGLNNLQGWCGVQDSDCPKLQSITIRNCSRLQRIPYFSSIKKLILSRLTITDVKLSVGTAQSQLQSLDIRDCHSLTSLIGLKYLCSLGSLYIARCPELSVFRNEKLPNKPQHFVIDDCLLMKDWCDEQNLYYQIPQTVKISDLKRAKELGIPYFQSFKVLFLDICPEKGSELILTPNDWLSSDLQLLSFCFETFGDSFHGHLSMLHRLEIRGCPKLIALVGLEKLDLLHSLVMADCPSLYVLPETKFPPHLSCLSVQGCHKLLSLHLNIFEPSMFIELELCGCQRLMYIGGLEHLTNLESLVLLHCPLLQLQELLPGVPEYVAVFLCPRLKKWCELQKIEYQNLPDLSCEADG